MYLLEVYVTSSAHAVDHPFTYLSEVPVGVFCRVKVAFHNGVMSALTVGCTHTEETKKEIEERLGFSISMILEVIDEDPVISKEQFELAGWLSRTTISPFIASLNAMLPKTLKTSKTTVHARMIEKIRKTGTEAEMTAKQRTVYESLKDGMKAADARKISVSIIRKLLEKGLIEIYEEEAVYEETSSGEASFKTLTEDQRRAYEAVLDTEKTVSLLYGVTGSGKTEVYLHLARHYLSQGKEVLILVPEIALTPQMIKRVRERFAEVVFYHSELSDQERYEQYQRIKNREAHIVVGTRSSVFLPFHDLGIIIIDEEHDPSYKQDSTPCYHVRNVAVKRALDHHAKVLLASATPSLDSYTRALKGDYQMLVLDKRINNTLPEIEIIDLSKEIRRNRDYILSKPLKEEIRSCLDNNKQAIILLNRRGYSPIVRCSSCNTTLMCEDCDIPLSYHKDLGLLKCHQCSRVYRVPSRCPNCQEKSLIYYGFGTKRAEEELQNEFPDARILRMDRDNVSRKGAHKEILDRFEERKADILIGTQMIAKGLDYPDVTLVGILNADSGLMHQDYNSVKLTFDLLMQASGRSGRAEYPGKVLIQAFNPNHYALKAVLSQDYTYFYNIEMNYRHKANYPPYSHFLEIVFEDLREDRALEAAHKFERKFSAGDFRLYPVYPLPKLQKMYRCRLLLLGKDLVSMIRSTRNVLDEHLSVSSPTRIRIDIDPLYLE